MKNKILYVVAAGSGGHILPALTLAKHWLAQTPDGKVVFWGSNKAIDQKIISNATFLSEVIGVNITGFSLKRPWMIPALMFWIVYSFFKAAFRSIKQRPEKIICTGGLIGLPICLAGRITGTPVEIYELNAIPGKAVKSLIPIANKIYIVFDETKKYCRWLGINFGKKCHLTQYPIRFSEQDRLNSAELLKNSINKIIERLNKEFNPTKPFTPNRKTIFVLGGSQGSMSLNKIIQSFLRSESNWTNQEWCNKIQIIHQVGGSSINLISKENDYFGFPAIVFSYSENIKDFYNLADLIICRAGAGTIFEVEFFQKTCIVIPLIASTTSHQVQNAEAMARKHPNLFTVIDQKSLEGDCKILQDAVFAILSKNHTSGEAKINPA